MNVFVRRSFMALSLGAVVALVGCAGSATQIDAAASRQLDVQLQRVRTSVEEGDETAARQALRSLERQVMSLRDDGSIGQERADEILAAAREVQVQLRLLLGDDASPSSSPSPTLAPSPSSSDEDEGSEEAPGSSEGHGNSEGNGKGKGNGNGGNEGSED